jgi:hypothetical protein
VPLLSSRGFFVKGCADRLRQGFFFGGGGWELGKTLAAKYRRKRAGAWPRSAAASFYGLLGVIQFAQPGYVFSE